VKKNIDLLLKEFSTEDLEEIIYNLNNNINSLEKSKNKQSIMDSTITAQKAVYKN